MTELAPGIDASQRVLAALKEARARLEAAERTATEPIAVIGIGCRFPGGADTPDEYWRLLLQGFDASGDIPRARYDAGAYYDPRPGQPGKMYVRRGAFLPAIEQFDAAFFAISPREAVSLDPQQRLLLEVSWEALEHAGQAADQLRGSRSGVFVGLGRTDYAHRLLQAGPDAMTAWHATGNGLCYGPGRLAHALDLRGPNMAVDTACSSSLVAVHLACQSLRLRECDLAIAGGSHVHLSPQVAIMLSASRALAADGRSKTFDAAADGFGQGEGCGIIILRRLSDALERRDNILALIRGTATNHDGHSSGLTVPNQAAQEQVIRDAVANARVEPHEIGYVEAHGTGTALGDPIEMEALATVLCADRPQDQPLRVGSVKTNIGHLEAAAGIAGLIKVVLALHHGQIPAHLHLREPNPRIAWDELPIRIPTQLTPWQRTAKRRLGGVSSFGMSGTNAHAILQEPPSTVSDVAEYERPLHAVTLSARSPSALREQARRFAAHLATNQDVPLPDVAFTANTGRTHLPVRVAIVAGARPELNGQLASIASGEIQPDIVDEDEVEPPGVVFLFSGQGSQYAGMARQSYATQPVVRRVLDHCDDILRPHLRHSLRDVLFIDANDGRLDQTQYTQPALFALEYALSELWRSWGVVPRAVLGHSVGEYVAACVAGVFGLEDGLRLIAERARLMQALPGGSMAAVFAGEARVRAAIGEDVSIAAINGKENVVIAGTDGSVSAVLARLEAEGIGSRKLAVSHAFHSPMMDPILRPFGTVAGNSSYAAPRIDLLSNVSGDYAHAPTADYWVRHVREPVRFADGLDTLARSGHRIFVEIGPGTALLTIARRHLADVSPLLLPTLMPGNDEWRPLLQSLSRLYGRGVPIDWAGFDKGYARRRVALPTYPFERQRFWYEDDNVAVPAPQSRIAIPAYRLTWRESSSPAPLEAPARNAGSWIVFADHDGVGARLGRLLEDRGDHVIQVEAGDGFARLPSRWTIDPARPADFASLLAEIPDSPGWKGIVFTWPCELSAPEPSAEQLMASQLLSCGGMLHLVQALAKHAGDKAPVWLVTRNAVALDSVPSEVPELAYASLAGMAKTIALEHPGLWGGVVDIPLHPDDNVLTQLVRELEHGGSEDHILLRNDKRFVARIEPFASPAAEPATLHADASYLITGGLGGLGLHVARWMIARGARSIVLLGRQQPSPAAQAAIAGLRASGATVTVLSADVTETADLQRVFAEIALLPMLRGVVHAAGVPGYKPFQELDQAAFAHVLRAKVRGAWLLHQMTARLSLDFFVCFSSIAALWGSKGQAHYAAANAFLDALAHYRQRRGLPALSIAWGPWVGDGMVTGEAQDWLARIGVRALRSEDAIAALERGLGCGEAHIAIADMDWERFRAFYAFGGNRGLLTNIVPEEAPATRGSPPARLEAEFGHLTASERNDWLVAHLRHEVSAVLGLEKGTLPDTSAGFFRLGMDSLMAVDLRDRLAGTFEVPLSATIAFDYPTIAELAGFLATDALGWERPSETADSASVPASAGSARDSRSRSGDGVPETIASKLARLENLVRET